MIPVLEEDAQCPWCGASLSKRIPDWFRKLEPGHVVRPECPECEELLNCSQEIPRYYILKVKE